MVIAEDAGVEKERLCRLIRSTEWGEKVYIIAMLERCDGEQVALALSSGADICVPSQLGTTQSLPLIRADQVGIVDRDHISETSFSSARFRITGTITGCPPTSPRITSIP